MLLLTYANPVCSQTQGQTENVSARQDCMGCLTRDCDVVVSHTGLLPPFLQVLMGEVLVPTLLCLVLGGAAAAKLFCLLGKSSPLQLSVRGSGTS